MANSSNYLSASRAVVSLGAWPVAPRPGEALVANAVAYIHKMVSSCYYFLERIEL